VNLSVKQVTIAPEPKTRSPWLLSIKKKYKSMLMDKTYCAS